MIVPFYFWFLINPPAISPISNIPVDSRVLDWSLIKDNLIPNFLFYLSNPTMHNSRLTSIFPPIRESPFINRRSNVNFPPVRIYKSSRLGKLFQKLEEWARERREEDSGRISVAYAWLITRLKSDIKRKRDTLHSRYRYISDL